MVTFLAAQLVTVLSDDQIDEANNENEDFRDVFATAVVTAIMVFLAENDSNGARWLRSRYEDASACFRPLLGKYTHWKKAEYNNTNGGGQFLTEVLQHYNSTMETMTELLDLEYSLSKWRK